MAFVDLAVGSTAALPLVEDAMRDLRPLLTHFRAVIFRWPALIFGEEDDDSRAAFEQAQSLKWLERLRNRTMSDLPSTALACLHNRSTRDSPLVVFEGGEQPASPALQKDFLLAACRSAELRGLLEAGQGIWEPRTYHFRLPSGHHSSSFIRVADGIRSQRDALVLSTWLLPHIEEGDGVVVDSPSLTGLVIQLRSLLGQAAEGDTPTVFLEEYPRTRTGVRAAVAQALGPTGRILGILSVNSSGRLLDLLQQTLTSEASSGWRIEVLVDKQSSQRDISTEERVDRWLRVGKGAVSTDSETCRLCRDHARSRLVHINPRSFEPQLLPMPVQLFPDDVSLDINREFFDLASASEAIAVEVEPAKAAGPRESRERMAVRFLYTRLLEDVAALQSAIVRRRTRAKTGDDPSVRLPVDGLQVDVVVTPYADWGTTKDGGFAADSVRAVLEALGVGFDRILPFNSRAKDGGWSASDVAALKTADHVLVLALGAVTGWTMERARACIRDLSPSPDPHISAVVLHSRPQSLREWEATCRIFDQRCTAIWQTPLPWDSPLNAEAVLLDEFNLDVGLDALPEEAADWFSARLEVVAPSDNRADWQRRLLDYSDGRMKADPKGILWGPALRGRWDVLTTYAATGSAVHSARIRARSGASPYWYVFAVRDAVTARYNAARLSCLIRWLEPSEIWWGGDTSAARRTARLLRGFVEGAPEELALLLPEILLASAQGKVHMAVTEEFSAVAQNADLMRELAIAPQIAVCQALMEWARA